jgi:hypothetical protein
MVFSVWITCIVGFVRAHPRSAAAAAATLVALLAAAWLPGGSSSTPSLPRAGRAQAAPPVRYYQAPFIGSLKGRSPVPAQVGEELCGYGPVPMLDGVAHLPQDIEEAATSALHRIAVDLAARSADRERALGMYLQMHEAWNAAGETWVREHGACADDDATCRSAVDDALNTATAASRRALVRLATTTSDPEAYTLALYSCDRRFGQSSIGECALLSSAQWARIEPDNALPWLYLAAEAQQRHDHSGFEAALNRASRSRYSDPHVDPISRFVGSPAFEAQPPPIQPQLAVTLLVIQSVFPIPDFQVATQYCRTPAQADPKFETCGNLAALLVEHSRTLIEVAIGGKIAELVGSTDPRLSALRDRADALRWELSQAAKSPQEYVLSSCESLQRLRHDMGIRAEFGEAGLWRRKLAESGVPTSQAAQQWRTEIQRRAMQQTGDAGLTR